MSTTADGHVTAIASAAEPKLDNSVSIEVSNAFSYKLDINGFGGSTFSQADYRGGAAFAIYRASGSELQISKATTPLSYATYGLIAEGGLCFYAVAPTPAARPISGQTGYLGFADGLSQIAGDADRLYRSGFVATYNASTRTYNVELDLKFVENAFDEPADQPIQSLGKATAVLTYENGIFKPGLLSGPTGFTGTIGGNVGGSSGLGATFYFELSDAQGNRIWGVAAADGALI